MRIVHVISGLALGGAERSLLRLVQASRRHEHSVISLAAGGGLAPQIRAAGVPLTELGLGRSLAAAAGLRRVGEALRHAHADVVQGWMYHANLAASAAALAGYSRAPVLWGVRQTLSRLSNVPLATRAVIVAGAALRFQPRLIIYNSHAAAADHRRIGYGTAKARVIVNGVDTERLAPVSGLRAESRRRLALDDDAIVAVRLARNDPMKDHETLLAAFALAAEREPRLHLLLAGEGMTLGDPSLARLVRSTPAGGRIHLCGPQADPAWLLHAGDVAVSSSAHSEGFPNALAEGMACGLCAVGTDIGETAAIIGDRGRIVPVRDPAALGAVLLRLAEMGPDARRAMGASDRARVRHRYGLGAWAAAFDAAWTSVARDAS